MLNARLIAFFSTKRLKYILKIDPQRCFISRHLYMKYCHFRVHEFCECCLQNHSLEMLEDFVSQSLARGSRLNQTRVEFSTHFFIHYPDDVQHGTAQGPLTSKSKAFERRKKNCETFVTNCSFVERIAAKQTGLFLSPYLRFFEANGTNWSASKPKIRSPRDAAMLRNVKNIRRA